MADNTQHLETFHSCVCWWVTQPLKVTQRRRERERDRKAVWHRDTASGLAERISCICVEGKGARERDRARERVETAGRHVLLCHMTQYSLSLCHSTCVFSFSLWSFSLLMLWPFPCSFFSHALCSSISLFLFIFHPTYPSPVSPVLLFHPFNFPLSYFLIPPYFILFSSILHSHSVSLISICYLLNLFLTTPFFFPLFSSVCSLFIATILSVSFSGFSCFVSDLMDFICIL